MSKELPTNNEETLSSERVMFNVRHLARTLGMLPDETVGPLRPDEVDNAEIVYNKTRDPNRDYRGEDWEPLPLSWESPYIPATEDISRKVQEFIASFSRESNSAGYNDNIAVKMSIERCMMEGVDTVLDGLSPDVILEVGYNISGWGGEVRLHGVKLETGGYEFKRPVIKYIDGEIFLGYEDPLPDDILDMLTEIIKHVNDGTWQKEQEYLYVEQMLGKEESWKPRLTNDGEKSFHIGDVLQFLSGRTLVPRKSGSDNMDIMLQIADYVTGDPNTSTVTGPAYIFDEVRDFLLENKENAQLLEDSGAGAVEISSASDLASYLRSIIDQRGGDTHIMLERMPEGRHIMLERMPEGRHIVIDRSVEEEVIAFERGIPIITFDDESNS